MVLGSIPGERCRVCRRQDSLYLRRAGLSCDFDAIWRRQSIDAHMLGCLLKAGEQASEVLNDPRCPVQNVSEWAKRINAGTI